MYKEYWIPIGVTMIAYGVSIKLNPLRSLVKKNGALIKSLVAITYAVIGYMISLGIQERIPHLNLETVLAYNIDRWVSVIVAIWSVWVIWMVFFRPPVHQRIGGNMKQLEKFKEMIAELDDPMDVALCIEKMREAAGYFCKENYPDEVCLEKDGSYQDVSTLGVMKYLKSQVKETEEQGE